MYYFLREDLDILDQKINQSRGEINKALQEAGDSCGQNSETWHDNPGYEEGQRGATMWSTHVRQLLAIRNEAHIVESPKSPPRDGKIRIGDIVVIKDLLTGIEQRFKLASAVVFDDTGSRISYRAPLGKAVLGKTIGDVLDTMIGDRTRKILILDIQ